MLGKRVPSGKYTAKEKDLRSIPDRISGTMRGNFVGVSGVSKRAWRNVRCKQKKNHAGCWNFKTLKESVEILNSIQEETSSQSSLGGGGGKSSCVIIIISLLIFKFS